MNKFAAFYNSLMLAIAAGSSFAIVAIGGNGWFTLLGIVWFLVLVVALFLERVALKAQYQNFPNGFFEWFFLVFFSVITPFALFGILWEIKTRDSAPA